MNIWYHGKTDIVSGLMKAWASEGDTGDPVIMQMYNYRLG